MMDDGALDDFYLRILRDLAAQPTAPFREERVAAHIGGLLREWGVRAVVDDWGNIIAHYHHGAPCRPLVLMAHMDHPAFVVADADAASDARRTARLLGGVPPSAFAQPVAVRVYQSPGTDTREWTPARVVGARREETDAAVYLELEVDDAGSAGLITTGDFGVWDLPDFAVREGCIYARVVDDLVGCAAALLTLWSVVRDRVETNVYGVFTRAEEVGLLGARAVLSGPHLPRDSIVVSLEASKALPGARQGDGPVIRAGDRTVTFDDRAEFVLRAAAARLGSTASPWGPWGETDTPRVQRQLMSGGRCEGSAAVLFGYATTGLAFPLGNYHNVADDGTLAPETVHVSDYLTGVALVQEATRLMPELVALAAEQGAAYATTGRLFDQLRASGQYMRTGLPPA